MTAVKTSWQFQHELIEAAQERGWTVVRLDLREGIVLEEPIAAGVVLRVSGRDLSSAFIRSLPEARQPEEPA
jgi:hypothetical protein